MGLVKLTHYQFVCDKHDCDKTHDELTALRPPLPEGWSRRPVYDCGLTGYTRMDIYCPGCTAKDVSNS